MIAKFLRHEFLSIVKSWPFILSCTLIPLLGTIALVINQNYVNRERAPQSPRMNLEAAILDATGLCFAEAGDLAGLSAGETRVIPLSTLITSDASEGRKKAELKVTRVLSPDEGLKGLEEKRWSMFLNVPADYLETNRAIATISEEASGDDGTRWLALWRRSFLRARGFGENEIKALSDPSSLEIRVHKAASTGRTQSVSVVQYLSSLLLILFLVLCTMEAMSTISDRLLIDRQVKTLDLYMTAAKPSDYWSGKLLGVHAASMLRTMFWLIPMVIAFWITQEEVGLKLNIAFVLLLAAFTIAGTAFWISLSAGILSFASSIEEARFYSNLLKAGWLIAAGLTLNPVLLGKAYPSIWLSLVPVWSPVTVPGLLLRNGLTTSDTLLSLIVLSLSALLMWRLSQLWFERTLQKS